MSQPRVCGPAIPAVDWQDGGAACTGEDPSLFFAPDYWETPTQKKARETKAKSFCRACPVQASCLEFGMAASDGHGIWGGLNEGNRRRLSFLRARNVPIETPVETVA